MEPNTTKMLRQKIDEAFKELIDSSPYNLGDISPSNRSKKEKIDFKAVYDMPVSYDTIRRIIIGKKVSRKSIKLVADKLHVGYCDRYHVIRHISEVKEKKTS